MDTTPGPVRVTGAPRPFRPASTAALLLAPLAAAVAAALMATALAFALHALLTAVAGGEAPGGWEDLGRVVVAMLVGAAAAVVGWAVALTVAARRVLPPGRRLLGVLGSGAAVAAWVVAASLLLRVEVDGVELPLIRTGAAAVAVLLPSVVFLVVGLRGRRR